MHIYILTCTYTHSTGDREFGGRAGGALCCAGGAADELVGGHEEEEAGGRTHALHQP